MNDDYFEQTRGLLKAMQDLGLDTGEVAMPAPPTYKRTSMWENAAGPMAEVLGQYAPAVLKGRGHATANVLSAIGQIAGGAVENRVKDRRLNYAADAERYQDQSRATSLRNEGSRRLKMDALMEGVQDRRQTERLNAAEERAAVAAREREAREEREWARREQMQAERFANQERLLRMRAELPENPGKLKSLRAMLSRQAENSREAQEFLVVRDYYQQGIKSLEASDNMGDLMAIRSLAKVSDKLTGIREGEQLSFEQAQGALLKAGMITSKMLGRGSFTPQARAAIARELQSIYDIKRGWYRNAKEHYRSQAELLGLPNPESIMLDLEGAGADSTGGAQGVSGKYF
jgi:hypothetical protein